MKWLLMLLLLPALAGAEALENVAPSKRVAQCNEWLRDHNVVGMAAKQGHCDEMKELNQQEGVNDERRAKITRLTDEVCASTNIDAWFDGYAKQCMGL